MLIIIVDLYHLFACCTHSIPTIKPYLVGGKSRWGQAMLKGSGDLWRWVIPTKLKCPSDCNVLIFLAFFLRCFIRWIPFYCRWPPNNQADLSHTKVVTVTTTTTTTTTTKNATKSKHRLPVIPDGMNDVDYWEGQSPVPKRHCGHWGIVAISVPRSTLYDAKKWLQKCCAKLVLVPIS